MLGRLSLLAVVVALTAACPATSSGLSNASATPASPAATASDLGSLTVDQALLYRDGGTIRVSGKLANGTEVKVRMDGAIGSETRGVFFITIGDAAERRLERHEADPIVAAVERAKLSLDARVADQFVDKLKAFRDGAG